MKKNIMIKKASQNDVFDIYEIEKTSFKFPFSVNEIRRMLIHDYALVAKIGGKVVGYCIFKRKNSNFFIVSIAIHPLYRRKGIASLLLSKTIEECKKLGCRKIGLHVRTKNMPAIRLYKKFGFKIKKFIPSYYSDGESSYYMELPL